MDWFKQALGSGQSISGTSQTDNNNKDALALPNSLDLLRKAVEELSRRLSITNDLINNRRQVGNERLTATSMTFFGAPLPGMNTQGATGVPIQFKTRLGPTAGRRPQRNAGRSSPLPFPFPPTIPPASGPITPSQSSQQKKGWRQYFPTTVPTFTQSWLVTIVTSLAALLLIPLRALLKGFFSKVIPGIAPGIPMAVQSLRAFWAALVKGAGELGERWGESFVQWLTNTGQKIRVLSLGIGQYLAQVWAYIRGIAPLIPAAGEGSAGAGAVGAGEVGAGVVIGAWAAVVTAAIAAALAVGALLYKFFQLVGWSNKNIGYLQALWNGIVIVWNGLGSTLGWIGKLLGGILGSVRSILSSVGSYIRGLASSFWRWFTSPVGNPRSLTRPALPSGGGGATSGGRGTTPRGRGTAPRRGNKRVVKPRIRRLMGLDFSAIGEGTSNFPLIEVKSSASANLPLLPSLRLGVRNDLFVDPELGRYADEFRRQSDTNGLLFDIQRNAMNLHWPHVGFESDPGSASGAERAVSLDPNDTLEQELKLLSTINDILVEIWKNTSRMANQSTQSVRGNLDVGAGNAGAAHGTSPAMIESVMAQSMRRARTR
jgi:hypothetical protein